MLHFVRRAFDPGLPSSEFSNQWQHPSDVFSVLLILGGDVVARALAQLVGSRFTPVAFSFGTSVFNCTLSFMRASQLTNGLCRPFRLGCLRDNRCCFSYRREQADATRRLLMHGH